MEQNSYKLDFIEVISLLKELNIAIPELKQAVDKLQLDVKVEAPVIEVNPTPIEVTEREMPSQIEAVITNLGKVEDYIKATSESLSKPLKIANLSDIKQAEINLKGVEDLLKKLLAIKPNVSVKVEPNISIPTDNKATNFMPVRLTDGKQFYNALAGIAKAGNNAVGLITETFDEIVINSYNANDDPTSVTYKLKGVTKFNLAITYDVNNRITRVVKT